MKCPKCNEKTETDGEICFHYNPNCEDDVKDVSIQQHAELWQNRAEKAEAEIAEIKSKIEELMNTISICELYDSQIIGILKTIGGVR